MLCAYAAQNNYQTKHLAKILIHLVWCLQECTSTTSVSSVVYRRAINAAYISSIFLKFIIENAKADNWLELCLDIDKNEKGMENFPAGNCLFTSSLICCKAYSASLLCAHYYRSDLAGIVMLFDVALTLEESTVEYFLMRGVLNYIGSVDVRYLIHHITFYISAFHFTVCYYF